jgi:hypothetical protein
MSYEDWIQIYEQMKAVFQRDKELTHIDISINIQPVKSEKKTAKINIKTYKDGNKI